MSSRKEAVTTRWWWIRHAPVVANEGRIYGQCDHPCVTDDQPAFAALARILPEGAAWVVSNLQRTHQTAAAIVAAGLAGPLAFPGEGVLMEPDLAEQSFGQWQGQTYQWLAAQQTREYHRFWLAPAHQRPPGGESFEDMMVRVGAVIDRLNRDLAGRDIIAVAHAGTIRSAIAKALNLEPEIALALVTENISVTRLDHFGAAAGGHAWRVAYMNRLPA